VLVDGTYEIAEACIESGVRKLVFSSTASVYGLAEQFPTREDHHPWANDTLYGAAKVWGEGLLRALHTTHGLDYVALRYFNVFGPRMDTHGAYTEVLIRWMERIERGEPPLIFGDGTATMDFVYTTDIARANIAAAEAPVTDRVFNVASSREVSLRGLADALLHVMGREDLGVEHLPPRTTAGGVTRRLADTSAAAEVLGFRAQVGLEEGLDQLVTWWRTQGREQHQLEQAPTQQAPAKQESPARQEAPVA
jgi:UDP-glucose 4-epimerase